MLLKEIMAYLEERAHPALQENYDNSGLIIGSPDLEVRGALICLDSTPEVIREAIALGCNLVIAHHPIIFSGLKKINGKNYIERTVIEAIKNDIAIYAIHTNLDNVHDGVNRKIADKLGLQNLEVLEPKQHVLNKIVVFVPAGHAAAVRNAMFGAGAGEIGNYDECSFNTSGEGTFRAGEAAKPFTGKTGELHVEQEVRIETIAPAYRVRAIIDAMKAAHPYEEVAFDVLPLLNDWKSVGSGLVGDLPEAMETTAFLLSLKRTMNTGCVRYTAPHKPNVKRIAVCGGSGSFLLKNAIRAKADVFVTADFKYHQFFDADGMITIADIGHYESEQYTVELLGGWLAQKFPTFATHLTGVATNPIHYL